MNIEQITKSEQITKLAELIKKMQIGLGSSYVVKDISRECWRNYEWVFRLEDRLENRLHVIEAPKILVYRKKGTTHRVVDAEGIAHCVPAPGNFGCVIRWKNPEDGLPVNF